MSTRITPRLVRLAAGVVVGCQAGSVHLVSRSVGVDLDTAAALMDELEVHGVVGPAKQPAGRMRDVLLTPDQLTRDRLDTLTVTAVNA